MRIPAVPRQDSEEVFAIRDFNRFYTARLGLLQKRYLSGEFSLTESRVLYEIWANPPITAASLREKLRLDKGYISRLLSSLIQRRLVRQSVSKIDNRERLLSLTLAGQKKVAALNQQSAAQIEGLLSGLSAEGRASLVNSLASARTLLTERSDSLIRVVRVSQVDQEALSLLHEYYEAVGVVMRDTPEAIRQIVKDPHGGLWIAYLKGKAVGCAYLHSLPTIPRATECKRLYVKPGARGHGAAHALLDAQEAFARKQGLERIYLDSKDDLKVAINLYAKRGYVPCERYNENPQATVFMVKNLADDQRPASGRNQRARRSQKISPPSNAN
jgi:DNA-binding MarR family transcriptional regulator/GNAT superfamily N-acetyltransferase